MKVRLFSATSLLLLLSATAIAQDANWQPITGAENLRQFMGGLKVERTLAGGEVSRGEYNADGTGTLFFVGSRNAADLVDQGQRSDMHCR